jgi:hypothetical protein
LKIKIAGVKKDQRWFWKRSLSKNESCDHRANAKPSEALDKRTEKWKVLRTQRFGGEIGGGKVVAIKSNMLEGCLNPKAQ